MQYEYVLRGGLFRGSRNEEDAEKKTKKYRRYVWGRPAGAIP
jgi:hypothetical protein